MTLTYNLSAEDYQNRELSFAAINKPLWARYRKGWARDFAIVAAMTAVMGHNSLVMLCFSTVLYLVTIGISFWRLRGQLKEYCKKYATDNYRYLFDRNIVLMLSSDQIYMMDQESEICIDTAELEYIYEVQHYYFLVFFAGTFAVTIPKRQIDDPGLVAEELREIAAQQSIDFIPRPGLVRQALFSV